MCKNDKKILGFDILNVLQASSPEAATKIAIVVLSAVKDFKALDVKPLEKYLQTAN